MASVHEAVTYTEDEEVDHPSHYTNGDIECIDAIEAALTPIEFRGYLRGSIIKYLWRTGLKGGPKNALKDLRKAEWYMKRLIERRKDDLGL